MNIFLKFGLISVLVITLLGAFGPRGFCEEETFPFVAEVVAPNVNLRAGQHQNFENLGRLKQGLDVVVVGKDYGWYKIQLTADAKSYISQDYIQYMSDSTGVVTGNRVNVRAGGNSTFTALGQAKKGTVVKILEKLPGWYRIEPVDGTYGWVSEQFLKFKSKKVPPVSLAANIALERNAADSPRVNPNSQESLSSLNQVSPQEGKKISGPSPGAQIDQHGDIFVSGIVESLEGNGLSADIRHQLVTEDHATYLLEGYKKVVDEFESYRVTVNGKIKEDPLRNYPHPVIVVSKINLVL